MGNPGANANNTTYYYANGRRVPLTAEPGVFAVKFAPGERSDSPAFSPEARHVLHDQSQNVDFIANYGLQVYRTDREGAVPIIQKEAVVQYASPAFRQSSGQPAAGGGQGQQVALMFATNRFLVQFKPQVTQDQITALNARYGVRVVQSLDYAENAYLLEIPDTRDATRTIAVANAYQESGLTVFADPNFIKRRFVRSVRSVAAPAVAPAAVAVVSREAAYLGQQWHLRMARVVDAWGVVGKGNPDIKIAILDDGVDVLHPEFNLNVGGNTPGPKVFAQYDFQGSVADGSPKGVEDNHGTACAGVATASGVMASGAAPGCRLIVSRTPQYLGVAEEAAMVKWAADNQADVISCSWGPQDGVGAIEPLAGPTSAAIHYCVTQGRGGKGIPVFWAAGNGHECIEQADGNPRDGYADNPDVMAIAASSSTEAIAWYSDFGKRIWVCAPSSGDDNAGEKRIFTVDRRGAAGYNPGDAAHGDLTGNYTNDFGGTSSATPLVAGIAALVLSAQPTLTEQDVRAILKTTADKIGGGYDADGHSTVFGYGRVNALAAVQAATQGGSRGSTVAAKRPSITGPRTISRSDPPPQFQVDPSPNAYYIGEFATQANVLDSTNHGAEQNDTNFFATWQGNPPPDRLTGPTYTLPQDVWDRLKAADHLYYRVGSTSSSDLSSWANYVTSVPDDQLSQAPSIQIEDSGGNGAPADRNMAAAAATAGRDSGKQPATVTKRDDTGTSSDGGTDASNAGDITMGSTSTADSSGTADASGTPGDTPAGAGGDTTGTSTDTPPDTISGSTTLDDTSGASMGDTTGATDTPAAMDGTGTTTGDTSGGDMSGGATSGAVVQGIDVSTYQGAVDWGAASSSGIAFAFMKATEGITFVDSSFQRNWTGARAAHVLRGAYHFFRPTRDAAQQADHFMQTVGALGRGDLPPVLDVEVADGVGAAAILDAVGVWLARVEQGLGRRPIIYTYPAFWRGQLGNSSRFADYALWIAHYTSATAPMLPGGWTTWAFWQRANNGHVGGIGGNVDLDVFNGSITDLDTLAGYTLPAEAAPGVSRDDIPDRLPRPVITGPEQWSRAESAPTFAILPGVNRYYAVEVVTQLSVILPANAAKRTPSCYFGSYDEQGLLNAGKATTYTLPANVWAQLSQSAYLYYRVLTASSPQPGWPDVQTSTADDELATIPSIALTGSGRAARSGVGAPVHPEEDLWRKGPSGGHARDRNATGPEQQAGFG